MVNKTLKEITDIITKRSHSSRAEYMERMSSLAGSGANRMSLSCGNLAHGFASCGAVEKKDLSTDIKPNIAIISSYNDVLSAHQPYEKFPATIKEAAKNHGGVAQFAGGTPAMCDGVTQGQPGMELSLFSRDVIAMATSVALSHNMFDGALCLGICDKIVPGLLIGSLSFGHLPIVFVPGGPMPSGIPHKEKVKIRQLHAEGKATREELLKAESDTYHTSGTCTFYGTANSNQMLMEIMGLQLPGSSFVNPNTAERDEFTRNATKQVIDNSSLAGEYNPLYKIIDEKAIVNGIVGLMSTGGSTNHTIHLVAIAKAAGINISWDDFSEISSITPLLTNIYPNGEADVNQFHDAGGMGVLIKDLLSEGLLHEDVQTIIGKGLASYSSDKESSDTTVLSPIKSPFNKDGGLKLLEGNLGRAIIKTSAIKPEQYIVEAPAKVFNGQQEFLDAFEGGKLNEDFVAVIVFQGPKSNGMPELHKLTPALGVLQDLGFKVALVTDGRMSGASGKVPAAIHVTPECLDGGNLAKIKDGDIIRLDAKAGTLSVKLSDSDLKKRKTTIANLKENQYGYGRELFSNARNVVSSAEEGASFIQEGKS